MYLIYSPKFLEHYQGSLHPESPERLIEINGYLNKRMKYSAIEARPVNEKDLNLVHSIAHIEAIKKYSAAGANFPDNKFSRNTFEIAKLTCGAALNAAQMAILKRKFAFALVRPPGHHAGKDFFGGFCYFNNLALAVRKLKKRTLVLDIDAHHGNGTQDIFYEDKNVFYASLHQHPATSFPGTGYEKENNEHVLNVPLEPNTDDKTYLEELKKTIEKVKKAKFVPQLVAISIGFDSYIDDKVANLDIKDTKTYFKIGERIDKSFSCPKFACLEGGYYLPKLGEMVYNFLRAFK